MSKRRWYDSGSYQKPKKIQGQLATRTAYYQRELWKIVKSMFDCLIPIEWDLDYFIDTIIWRGYIIISTTPAGVLPIKGSLTGVNYINLPTTAVMTAPLLGNWENTIGVDCEILFLERDIYKRYYRFIDKVNIYAEQLASADGAIDVNIMNSKMAYIAEAETKAQSDTIKEMYDQISEGNPLVVYRKDSLSQKGMQVFFGNVKQNFVCDMLQDTKRTIMNEFLTSIGINNANTDKRERLVTDEVNANNVELQANTAHWKAILERQLERTRKVFPDLDIDVKLRFDIPVDMTNILNPNVGEGGGKDEVK